MKTLEEALPAGVIKPLDKVVQETGLDRSAILVKGVSYRAANDSVVRGPIAHKGFIAQTSEPTPPPADETRHSD